ncbi:MAG: 3-deoxy-manno-octulosonate cytidylyltransferase [Pseudomonadales bacterium]
MQTCSAHPPREPLAAFSIVIPARYASARLPGKPLADIAGKPMIQRVYELALQAAAIEVLVATDDQRIADAVEGFGGKALLTSAAHPSGTDRLCEVAEQRGYSDQHIIVNLQGDEPEMPILLLQQVASNLQRHPAASIATLCTAIDSVDELLDPNVVKVVRDSCDFALYFSRAAIPYLRSETNQRAALERQFDASAMATGSTARYYRHLGLYAYRVRALRDFVRWPVASLEQTEKLEQLRAMSNGLRIHCAEASAVVPAGVDSPEDLARVRAMFNAAG